MNMSTEKNRSYRSDARKAQARQTRAKILSAARDLFREQGFEGVTIDKIAQVATVSSPTVYALFQSKRGVLKALMDEALPSEHFEALVEEAMQEKSAAKHLRISAKMARQIYDAERAQMDIFQGAAAIAPEFKVFEKEREERRYQRQEMSINLLAGEGALLTKLSKTKARDILWAFTGRDLYRMFVVEQGWTSDEYERWLGQLLIDNLVEPDRE
jgi:AcrR family transcriptional regulator